MIYVITFFMTALFAYFMQRSEQTKNKIQFKICSLFVVLIPSTLGAIRSEYLGTDNIVYKAAFNKILGMKSPVQAVNEGQFEPLYNILCFAIGRVTADYHWVCFFTELITLSFILAGLYYFRHEIPIWIGMLIYLFCQYCNVMNLVRQGIALSICFFALRYALERKWIKYILWIVLAISFHTSAYIALLIILIVRIVDEGSSTWRILGFIIFSIIGVVGIPKVAQVLIGIGVLPTKYLSYVGSAVSISRAHTLYRLPVLTVATMLYSRIVNKFDKYKVLYMMLWMEMIIVQVASIFDPAYRMSLYFSYASLIIIPSFRYAFNSDIANRMFLNFLIISYLIVYWVFFTVMNWYGFRYPTYPFVTDLL